MQFVANTSGMAAIVTGIKNLIVSHLPSHGQEKLVDNYVLHSV